MITIYDADDNNDNERDYRHNDDHDNGNSI